MFRFELSHHHFDPSWVTKQSDKPSISANHLLIHPFGSASAMPWDVFRKLEACQP